MTRLVIAGHVDVPPAVRDQVLRDAEPYIALALAERGCVTYSWTADLGRPGRIRVFEEWICEADLADHLSGDAYRAMLGHLSGAGIIEAVTAKYQIARSQPVYDPQGRPRADFFET